MKYDFTTIMDRAGHDAIAVDLLGTTGGMAPGAPKEGFDAIPMWVADMNFPVVEAVQKSITARTNHPAFGYFSPREEYYKAIIDWQRDRNGVTELTSEHIGYENGVLGGVVSALSVLCSRGDKILMHSPTYIGFTFTLDANGYHPELSPLVRDAEGVWRMDYEDMERRIVENNIHAAIFCSPHNPCGRVWEPGEIERAYEIFERHNVYVISDEIWSDLILKCDGTVDTERANKSGSASRHTPSQSISDYARSHTVALYAPSKTFNLAGLVGSYHIIYDKWLRDRVDKAAEMTHYNEMNVLSMYALMGAYSVEGREWLEELRDVLTDNVEYAYRFIVENLPGLSCAKPQGTYMLFVDCTEYCKLHNRSLDEVLKACWDVGVALQDGRPFHGECHMRINLAVPHARVIEAFYRLKKYVFI